MKICLVMQSPCFERATQKQDLVKLGKPRSLNFAITITNYDYIFLLACNHNNSTHHETQGLCLDTWLISSYDKMTFSWVLLVLKLCLHIK